MADQPELPVEADQVIASAWLDFLTRAASSHGRWLPTGAAREAHRQQALDLWYRSP